MPDVSSRYKYLPDELAERLRHVQAQIAVRKQMDAGMQGLHSSPAFGSSVEFAEYREYIPGDPIQRIDWPVYARTDKYVIRRYQEEVSIRTYVLLDISESMSFQLQGSRTKLEHACYLAAGFMYLMVRQGDACGLITFDDQIRDQFELAGSLPGLRPMLEAMERAEPKRKKGDIADVLHTVAEMIPGRALIVLVSDCLQDPADVLHGIRHLDHDGKAVTVFHVLDEGEMHLPEKGLAELIELETGERMQVDFSDVRQIYAAKVNRFLDELRMGCTNLRADYILAPTQGEVHDTLFMRSRAR